MRDHRLLVSAAALLATLGTGMVPVPVQAAEELPEPVVTAPPAPDEDAIATPKLPPCNGRNLTVFTAADFQRVLGLSRPVAERAARVAADLRDVDHLLAVEGIGPGQLAAIQRAHADLCTAPPQVPPAPKNACVASNQFDLNDLDDPTERQALDRATVLSQNEVATIARMGPFASVEVALTVLGKGLGAYKKLMEGARPTLCVTPPGFVTTGGTSYEWVSSYLDDQVAADQFALTVAAGTLTEPDGSWAYIDREDIPLGHGAPPVARADVHLQSNRWQGPGRTVWITVPADRSPTVPGVPLEQTVWHETATGATEWFRGAAILEDAGRLTIAASSTSWFTSVVGFVWEAFRWIRGRSVGAPDCSRAFPPPSGSFHTGSLLSNGNGGLIGECTYGNHQQLGAVGATDRIRAEFSATYTPIAGVNIDNPGAGDDLVASIVARLWSGLVGSFGSNTNVYLPPAASYWDGSTFVTPPSSGQYRIDPNIGATVLGVVGDQTFGLVLNPLNDFVKGKLALLGIPGSRVDAITDNAIESLISCGYGLYRDLPEGASNISSLTYNFFRTCLPEVFEDIVEWLADEFVEDGLEDAFNTLLRVNVSFEFIDDIVEEVAGNKLAETAAQVAATLVDIGRAFVVDRNVYLSAPAIRPTTLDSGQAIPSGCIRGDGATGYRVERSCVVPPSGGGSTYIVKVIDDPLAFVVRNGINIGEFGSGGDYICAAQSLLVRFVLDRSFTEVYGTSSERLSCPAEVGGPPRDVTQHDNVLLRMSDGTTYFRNSSTMVGIEHVLDGGCFEQLAVDHLGFDYVTLAEVQSVLQDGWEIDDASAACQ